LAIATIVETKGSTPQVQGTSAIFGKEGLIQGTLGGGILEADAQKRAADAIEKKESQLYESGLDAGINTNDTGPCGGKAVILIDASPQKHLNVFRDIQESLGNRQPGILATLIGRLRNGKTEITRYWIDTNVTNLAGLNPELTGYKNLIEKCINENETVYLPVDNISYFKSAFETLLFLEPILTLPVLVVAGAGHVGQAVANLGSLLDFEVTVIDDRPEYCNSERIPEADHYIVGNISKAMKDISKTTDTYIVIVTRNHRSDADTLKECITSEVAYIGMMGSKRKVGLTREKFLEEGWATASQFDRIHAPIGLEIGSQTVHEIAVSICAQLISVRRQKHKKKKKAVISSIILAAGESRRMGQPKLLLPYGETTIIEAVIREAIQSEVNHTVIVLGSENENISKQISNYPLIITENREFHLGMLSSIQCGLRAVPDNTDAVLLLLGDQPMIPASVINDVIKAYKQTDKGIVIAAHNGKRGHPILFDMKYKQKVEQLDSDQSLHDFTRKHPDDIHETEVETPVILRDIDTINDYNKELKYRRLT